MYTACGEKEVSFCLSILSPFPLALSRFPCTVDRSCYTKILGQCEKELRGKEEEEEEGERRDGATEFCGKTSPPPLLSSLAITEVVEDGRSPLSCAYLLLISLRPPTRSAALLGRRRRRRRQQQRQQRKKIVGRWMEGGGGGGGAGEGGRKGGQLTRRSGQCTGKDVKGGRKERGAHSRMGGGGEEQQQEENKK